MTAHELAKKLLEGPNLMVTVRGYEGGVDEITTVSEPEDMMLNYNEAWYYGKHEYMTYNKENERGCKITKAINLGA